jgi:hypothetical protein
LYWNYGSNTETFTNTTFLLVLNYGIQLNIIIA